MSSMFGPWQCHNFLHKISHKLTILNGTNLNQMPQCIVIVWHRFSVYLLLHDNIATSQLL